MQGLLLGDVCRVRSPIHQCAKKRKNGWTLLIMRKLHYMNDIPPARSIPFMWSREFLRNSYSGFSFSFYCFFSYFSLSDLNLPPHLPFCASPKGQSRWCEHMNERKKGREVLMNFSDDTVSFSQGWKRSLKSNLTMALSRAGVELSLSLSLAHYCSILTSPILVLL